MDIIEYIFYFVKGNNKTHPGAVRVVPAHLVGFADCLHRAAGFGSAQFEKAWPTR